MEKQKQIKNFSDLMPKTEGKDFEGEWIGFEDLIGKEVIVLDFLKTPGNYGYYVIIQIEIDGKKAKTSTGATAIMENLERLKQMKEAFPFKVKIDKKKSDKGMTYYVFE